MEVAKVEVANVAASKKMELAKVVRDLGTRGLGLVVSRGADGLEVLLLVDERLKLKLKGEKKSNGLSKRIIRVRYYVDKCG